MRYRTFPGTGLTASVICLGTATFGTSTGEPEAFELLDRFVAEGGNFIDTALIYGEWVPGGHGLSERTVGRWIEARGRRDDIVLATKGGHPSLSALDRPRLSPRELVDDLDQSLRNLRTDRIDLYWLHRDDPRRPVAEVTGVLEAQVRAGKIRAFGCSNWSLERLRAAPFRANQLMWSLAEPDPDPAAHPVPGLVTMDDATYRHHRDSGLPAVAYSAQANGFFAKLRRDGVAGLPEPLRRLYGSPANVAKLPRLEAIARDLRVSVTAASVAYLLNHEFPTYAIVGCTHPDQLADTLRAADVRLGPMSSSGPMSTQDVNTKRPAPTV